MWAWWRPRFLILCTVPFILNAHNESYCQRSWPELEIFLPVNIGTGSRDSEYLRIFLRSFLMFWPPSSNTSLRIFFDEEKINMPEYHVATNSLWTAPIHDFKVDISLSLQSPYYNGRGYDRQQLLMFYADNYTTKEYVGFVDTDCLFISYVDREDLFEDGKPVVNGRIGYNPRKPWSKVPGQTWAFTGMEEPMR